MIAMVSLSIIILIFIAIRKQAFVSLNQYYNGMIPHHSMALLMSKRILENNRDLSVEDREFIKKIIDTQEKEIDWMKTRI
jgi:uncharacterized protein (DUF305 family)